MPLARHVLPLTKALVVADDAFGTRAVKEFAESYKQSGRKLHCLINNAGTALPPHSITENGFEV